MRPQARPQFQVLVPALALALGACTGTVGGGVNPGTGTGGGALGGNGAGGIGTGGVGTTGAAGSDVLATCPTTAVTPTPLRRLTRFEYTNSARNLLGISATAAAAANDLPADEVTDGFNNNAGVLTVSPLHAEKYVLVSEALAKEAVKNLSTLTGGCNTATRGEDGCATDFATSFGRRAFRRPTTAED